MAGTFGAPAFAAVPYTAALGSGPGDVFTCVATPKRSA